MSTPSSNDDQANNVNHEEVPPPSSPSRPTQKPPLPTQSHHTLPADMSNNDQTDSFTSKLITFINKEMVSSMFAGMVAGAAGVLIGHPFDTLKVRMQVKSRNYSTIKINIFNLKDIASLYRGWIPPVATAGILQSINFALYENGKNKFVGKLDMSHTHSIFVSGVYSGIISSFLMSPIHLVKIQQQTIQDINIRQVVRGIISKYGFRGFYHGFATVVVTDSIGRGIYFASYEFMKEYLTNNSWFEVDKRMTIFLSAAFAGSFCWSIMYPFDAIKSRLQADMTTTAREVVRNVFKNEHIGVLYRGSFFAIIRSAPVAMTTLPLYEWARHMALTYLPFE